MVENLLLSTFQNVAKIFKFIAQFLKINEFSNLWEILFDFENMQFND